MVFNGIFYNDGGSSMGGAVRLLGIVYGVVWYAGVPFRGEVRFRD
jgi:hypothetical protein